jgi:hypothetical protein
MVERSGAERAGNAWRSAAIAAGAIGGGLAIWSAIAARAA